DLRTIFHRLRDRGGSPRNCIEVSATVARAAAEADIFYGQLDRWQWCVLTDRSCCHLVHALTNADRVFQWLTSRQEDGCGPRMVSAGSRSGGGLMGQIADYGELTAIFFQRAQTLRELKVPSLCRRCPLVHGRAMWHIETAQPSPWNCSGILQRRLGRHHGF